MSVLRGENPLDHVLDEHRSPTAHCATCTCHGDEPGQPSTSSPGIRRMALQAAETAVRAAKDSRKKPPEVTA